MRRNERQIEFNFFSKSFLFLFRAAVSVQSTDRQRHQVVVCFNISHYKHQEHNPLNQQTKEKNNRKSKQQGAIRKIKKRKREGKIFNTYKANKEQKRGRRKTLIWRIFVINVFRFIFYYCSIGLVSLGLVV